MCIRSGTAFIPENKKPMLTAHRAFDVSCSANHVWMHLDMDGAWRPV